MSSEQTLAVVNGGRSRLRIPSLGARSRPVDLSFGDDGLTHGIQIEIEYKGSTYVSEVSSENLALDMEEVVRLSKLRGEHSKETAPELWDPKRHTRDWNRAQMEHCMRIVRECVARVHGIDCGGRASESIEDRQEIAKLLYAAGPRVLVAAYRTALEKQEPKDEQLFS